MDRQELDFFAAMLRDRLARILERTEAAARGLSLEAATHADMNDRASFETDRNIMLIMCERDRLTAADIARALERMEEGEYGVCLECGEDIAPARLRAEPTAVMCVHCASLLEEQRHRFLNTAPSGLAAFGE